MFQTFQRLVPHDKVIVEEEDLRGFKKTEGGLYVPKTNPTQTVKKCKVLAISDDVYEYMKEKDDELKYDVGDYVIHHSQTGIKVNTADPKDLRFFLKYDAIMAVVCGDDKDEA